jgi:endonuclease/exonuclease/phosphatase family metal-dependent hydrolase
VLLLALPVPAAAQSPDLRVMSFNIRYGTADDGENRWELRRDLLVRVVRDFDPDILGVQEALAFQLDEVRAALGGYAQAGVGRDDGVAAGEFSAILFDTTRVVLLEQGTFWFSDSPSTPGSMSWGNTIPRICTWARFRDRADGATFRVYNVHWDHIAQPSRERSAALLLERIAAAGGDEPVLITGDFNAGEGNNAFVALTSSARVPLFDTFRALHPDSTEVGTFHGFDGRTSGEKIDAILAGRRWEVRSASIVRTAADGRYPSDHYPVIAVLRRR